MSVESIKQGGSNLDNQSYDIFHEFYCHILYNRELTRLN